MVTAINSCQKPLETFYCCESVDYVSPPPHEIQQLVLKKKKKVKNLILTNLVISTPVVKPSTVAC